VEALLVAFEQQELGQTVTCGQPGQACKLLVRICTAHVGSSDEKQQEAAGIRDMHCHDDDDDDDDNGIDQRDERDAESHDAATRDAMRDDDGHSTSHKHALRHKKSASENDDDDDNGLRGNHSAHTGVDTKDVSGTDPSSHPNVYEMEPPPRPPPPVPSMTVKTKTHERKHSESDVAESESESECVQREATRRALCVIE
jgi:hypothetical protein